MSPTELASFRTLAQHELDHLHECPVCIGTREDDGMTCQRCGGTGRWDDRKPLADALLKVLDALDAADREIARLQAGIYTRDQRIAEAAAAMAENKRMREALERIRDSDDVRDWAQNVAAEALGGQPT